MLNDDDLLSACRFDGKGGKPFLSGDILRHNAMQFQN